MTQLYLWIEVKQQSTQEIKLNEPVTVKDWFIEEESYSFYHYIPVEINDERLLEEIQEEGEATIPSPVAMTLTNTRGLAWEDWGGYGGWDATETGVPSTNGDAHSWVSYRVVPTKA